MLDNLNSNFESSKAQRPDANDDEVEIDLLEIFYALKKKILLVLMVALVGGCIAAAYTQFLMTPIYSSTSLPKAYSIITELTAIMTVELQKASLSLNKKIWTKNCLFIPYSFLPGYCKPDRNLML